MTRPSAPDEAPTTTPGTIPDITSLPQVPSIDDLLAEARQNDPQLAALVELLMQQQEQNGQPADVGTVDAYETTDPYEQPARPRRPHPTRPDFAEAEELALLRRRNDTLAAATGACHLCWGDDLLCPLCVGRGGPGWQPPDPWAHQRYIAPIRPVEEGSDS